MEKSSRTETARHEIASCHGSGLGRRLTADVATLVLALATGMSFHSAENFLPHAGKQATPYLGV